MRDAARLTDVLVSRYGLPLEIAERDVSAIVSQWVDHALRHYGHSARITLLLGDRHGEFMRR